METSENTSKDWILTTLKNMGVKIPKIKHLKSSMSKRDEDTPHLDRRIFGVSLIKQEWIQESDDALPKFLVTAIEHLSKFSTTEGLFRKAGSITRQKSLKIKLKNGESLKGSHPHDAASLLKQWLRELPEPLIPHSMHDLFIRCQQLDVEDCVTASLLCCLLLPPVHLQPLKHLMRFLKAIHMHSSENKMTKGNLALVLAPNIFTSKTGCTIKNCLIKSHASVIELLIENADRIGQMPLAVSFHRHIRDERSKFDSPSDILESGPSKITRKLKVGPVQDVFGGIKKFVGHNTTPALNLKTLTQAKFWTSRKLVCRPVLLNEAETFSTPLENEDMQAFRNRSKSDSGQRKSFGFLRPRDRKRQSSVGSSSQAELDIEMPQLNLPADVMDSTLQVPTPSYQCKRRSLIVRGKPNTTKNGLTGQNFNKEHVAVGSLNTEETIYQSDSSFLTDSGPNVSETHQLSPNVGNTPDQSNKSSAISIPKISPSSNGESSHAIVSNKEQASPLLRSQTIFRSNSKIPKLILIDVYQKGLSKPSCDRELHTPQSRSSRKPRPSRNSKIPILVKRRPSFTDPETTLNDSCFQTPNQTLNSLNSTAWMSCCSILSTDTPKEVNYNRRQSIALILKNNSGFVLEQIHLYESMDRKNSTPTNAESNSLDKTPQKRISCKQNIRTPRRISVKNRTGTPFRRSDRPLKLAIDFEAISPSISQPLKEVTNVNGKQNTRRTTSPVSNILQKSMSPNDKNYFSEHLRKAKLKRHSFSGQTPAKFSKVSRSESFRSDLEV